MNIFFDLLEVQQIALLTEWLDLRSFKKFHFVAISNTQFRKELVPLITSPQCVFDSCEMRDENIEWAVKNGVRFREINLEDENLSDEHKRRTILRHFASSLEEIVITLMARNEPDNDTEVRPIDLASVLEHLTLLCLRLKGLHIFRDSDGENFEPTDDFACIPAFVSSQPSLESISLGDFDDIPVSWLPVLSSAPSLHTVDLSECSLEPDASLPKNFTPSATVRKLNVNECAWVCKMFPNITSMGLSGADNAATTLVLETCQKLQKLELYWGGLILEYPIKSSLIVAICTVWTELNWLVLCYSGLTEAKVLLLVQRCVSLAFLNTYECLHYEESFDTVPVPQVRYPTGYAGSRLHTLYTYCDSADTLKTIIACCPYLHTLHLIRSMHHTSIVSVEHALRSLVGSSVQRLYMSHYEELYDVNLLELQQSGITCLALHHCHKLTTAGIVALALNMPKLHTLTLRGCKKVKYKVKEKIQQLCPWVKYFLFDSLYEYCERCPAETHGLSLMIPVSS